MSAASFNTQWMGAARQALQWRLLLLWLLALMLPLLMALLPLWMALAGVLDRAPLAARLLDGTDIAVLAETLGSLGPRGYSPAGSLGAAITLLVLLPWLTGTVVAAARSPHVLGFGALLQGGLAEYGAMCRLYLWALLPLGVAGAIGGALVRAAGEAGQAMLLETDATLLKQAALAVGALLFLLANATVDAARAQLALEPRRRSVVKAWWRGVSGLLRRPGRIALFVLLTVAGLLLASLLGLLRIQVSPVGAGSFVLALVLGQALVLVLVWMRCARIFGLVAAARR